MKNILLWGTVLSRYSVYVSVICLKNYSKKERKGEENICIFSGTKLNIVTPCHSLDSIEAFLKISFVLPLQVGHG